MREQAWIRHRRAAVKEPDKAKQLTLPEVFEFAKEVMCKSVKLERDEPDRQRGSPSRQREGGRSRSPKKDEEAAIVKVRLSGACETCAMSAQTLKMGIEKHLVQTFPEVVGVIQVL